MLHCLILLHCISGGSEPESTEEACGQEAAHVAAGYVTTKEVSLTLHQQACCSL